MLIWILLGVLALSLMPLGDDNEGRLTTPFVTYILIALNIAVFFLLQGGGSNQGFTYGYSVVPREIMSGQDYIGPASQFGGVSQMPGPNPIYLTLFSAMFMHGNFLHLAGNLLYLWIFGDNLEDAMGHFKFVLFYLLCGVLATGAHILSGIGSFIPSLGASGAIAGVLGGYLLMYPTRGVRVLLGYMGIVQMPAFIVLGFWGLLQFFNGFGALHSNSGGVAYMAHIGGFIAGLILVKFFSNATTQQRAMHRMEIPPDHSYWTRPPN